MNLAELAHDVGTQLAQGRIAAPLDVLHAAAKLVLAAKMGHPPAIAKVRELGESSEHMRALLGMAHDALHAHPAFWTSFYAPPAAAHATSGPHGHHGGHHHGHGGGRRGGGGVVWAEPVVEYVEPEVVVLEQPDEVTYFDELPPVTDTAGASRALPGRVVVSSPRSVGDPLGQAGEQAWMGPWGEGGRYLKQERKWMDRVETPDDREPEWSVRD